MIRSTQASSPRITTSLVFDADGNYLPDYSGIDNNYSTGEAIEYAELPLNDDGSDATYQIAITRALTRTGSTLAARLRYFAYTGSGYIEGNYVHTGQPTLFGHSAARNADGVAAYDVHDLTIPEDFTSSGPVTILFDTNGNRLLTPEIRQQPTIAAVDGVNTTFFPQPIDENDSDGDGYPNFYGTSAAAPHAAAVAALLLQAAGGPNSLTADQMRSLLESTAGSHDLDPSSSSVTLTSADGLITLTMSANGDDSNNSAYDQDFFKVTFTGPAGANMTKLAVDIGKAGEVFDSSTTLGYPFKFGDTTGVVKSGITETLGIDNAGLALTNLVLTFAAGSFESGGRMAFGLDRDDAGTHAGGNSADLLAGTKIKAKFTLADGTPEKLKGVLANKTGQGYSPDVGYGLINAQAALAKLLGQ